MTLMGLHQAQLLAPATDEWEGKGFPKLVDCKSLKNQSDTVEFGTSELKTGIEKVMLQVIDVDGNFVWREFPIDVTRLLPRGKVVSIPDANLKAVVQKTLELSRRDRITQLDMLQLTSLEAEKRQITDLTGLEHAKNLKLLILGANQIRDVTPLTGLTQLKTLILWENQITDLTPISGLPHLTHLNLSSNPIRDHATITEFVRLRGLHLGGNQVRDVSFLAKLPQLQELFLGWNQINDITPLTRIDATEGFRPHRKSGSRCKFSLQN